MTELTFETAKLMYESSDPVTKQFALDNYPELETPISVKCWEDLGNISGFFVGAYSTIEETYSPTEDYNRNTFATESQAEASIALAQLSQLMKQVNGDWIPDYTDDSYKCIIFYSRGKVTTGITAVTRVFLTFRSAKIRDEFLLNHKDLIEIAKPLL